MSTNRVIALLVGAATCLFALVYAAPIFGADRFMAPQGFEGLLIATDMPDAEAMMAPLRLQAYTALAKLEARARHD